jgi:hypothetical protein
MAKEPVEAQKQRSTEKEASYVISFINPKTPLPSSSAALSCTKGPAK